MAGAKHKALRGRWDNKGQFLLACIGNAVGLGNIWRFPYLCFKSGGGAFLIPYLITLLLCGIPLLYLEMAIGQYTRFGPVHAISTVCPLMGGVGVATLVISFILCTYYNVIMSWTFYYLFSSFSAELPWYSCEQAWSTPNCTTNGSVSVNSTGSISPTQDFFDNALLQKTAGIHDMGGMRWELLGCFALAWTICYLCIFKGIKSAGKVVYFTVTFPYLILFTLLVTSCTLPGAGEGLLYFVRPVWKDLLRVDVWINAAAQNFNSIGIAFGSMITFASYNKRNNDVLRDTLVVAGINSATSLLAGFVIFAAMGHMAHLMGCKVPDVATEGPELVFIVYPQLFATLPAPQLWSVLFFSMLVALGIDSQFAMVEVVQTALADACDGRVLRRVFKQRKELLSLAVCAVAFLLGLPNLARGGIYVFTLLDNYTAIVSLMFIAFFEVVALCWLYGARRVADAVADMTGRAPPLAFQWCWRFVCPTLIGALLVVSVAQYKPAHYDGKPYPRWADAVGWIIALLSMCCIPAWAALVLWRGQGSFRRRLADAVRPRDLRDEVASDENSFEKVTTRADAAGEVPKLNGDGRSGPVAVERETRVSLLKLSSME